MTKISKSIVSKADSDNENNDRNDRNDRNDHANGNNNNNSNNNNYVKEAFFNRCLYEEFTKKYEIGMLSKTLPIGDGSVHTNNNLHHIDIITPDDLRMTSEIMTKFEYTRIVAERAKQIENGAAPFIKLDPEVGTDPIEIAEKEILLKKCPMKIKRKITKNIIEIWRVNEMIVPFDAR